MKNVLIGLILLISSSPNMSCATNPPPVQAHPTPVVKDMEYCKPAEDNLTKLCNLDKVKNAYCCQTVAPTKKNKSFSQVCQETQNNGVFLNPKCLSTINLCTQIDTCTGSK